MVLKFQKLFYVEKTLSGFGGLQVWFAPFFHIVFEVNFEGEGFRLRYFLAFFSQFLTCFIERTNSFFGVFHWCLFCMVSTVLFLNKRLKYLIQLLLLPIIGQTRLCLVFFHIGCDFGLGLVIGPFFVFFFKCFIFIIRFKLFLNIGWILSVFYR